MISPTYKFWNMPSLIKSMSTYHSSKRHGTFSYFWFLFLSTFSATKNATKKSYSKLSRKHKNKPSSAWGMASACILDGVFHPKFSQASTNCSHIPKSLNDLTSLLSSAILNNWKKIKTRDFKGERHNRHIII